MKALIELKKGTTGYLWHGTAEAGSFAIIKTANNELIAGIIKTVGYHY